MKIHPIILIVLYIAGALVIWIFSGEKAPTAADNLLVETSISDMQSTPLHEAAQLGDLEACQSLLEAGSDLEALNENGETPLLVAVQYDHVGLARMFIERGAKLAYKFKREDTKEAREAEAKRQEAVQKLMSESGAMDDVLNSMPEEHRDALREAMQEVDVAAMMIDFHFEVAKQSAIEYARGIPMLTLLLKQGADINHVDGGGYSPLSSFAEAGNLEVVSWLLDQNADPNVTSTGETPIFRAIYDDNHEMVKLLLSKGARLDVQDVDGWSPLFCCKSLEMASYLIEQGADPTVTDQAGFPCWNFVDDPDARAFLKENAVARGLKNWTEL